MCVLICYSETNVLTAQSKEPDKNRKINENIKQMDKRVYTDECKLHIVREKMPGRVYPDPPHVNTKALRQTDRQSGSRQAEMLEK